ncbi:MAG: hypothetical protein UU11_C0001G0044 [Parcubacteria group bacterium GW2011_GWF2_40_69]|nr:MAG: hypothetical protein UT25_C0002G0056 [Parcubacteria group bacterium GW2011_GWC1_39_12]KKR19445.1 MAG: hypothetical protein UT49_C0002G0291 [Parcubacteria group bacterium GW2011_GWF1_39_37]KKR35071.1 MAG: hypothetical protein UT68_C0005G0020 [Parcubacteria group bacterium GW2011_GWC2_40_10]KKR52394.1 MAG: hypothetical protein UT89_C0002G0195 [Parcubacteria group bacterium GW2011_GWE1_40_20]KKR69458.1 MAG: hypothetical protein UU11_C0001G0044 [Parcubacteria group bacterium GW2011_GWF2_40_
MAFWRTISDRLVGASVLPRSIVVPVSNSVDLGLVYTALLSACLSEFLGKGLLSFSYQLVGFLGRGNFLRQVDHPCPSRVGGIDGRGGWSNMKIEPVPGLLFPQGVRHLCVTVVPNHLSLGDHPIASGGHDRED